MAMFDTAAITVANKLYPESFGVSEFLLSFPTLILVATNVQYSSAVDCACVCVCVCVWCVLE